MFSFNNKYWALFLFVVAIVYCLVESQGEGDLLIYLSAARDLSTNTDIYLKSYLDGYHYYYSVLFAIVLRPFSYLPFFWVKFFWLALNLFLFCRIFLLMTSAALVKELPDKRQKWFLICIFLFTLRFLHENLHTAQITILIFWCCIYSMYYISQNKPWAGSALLALGINLKLLPLVLLPYLLYRGYFKALILTMLFYVASLWFPSFIVGHEYNTLLLKSWLALINPTDSRHILDVDERSFHGLSTLLSTLLVAKVPDLYAMDIKRNIADISLPALSAVLLAVRSILVLFTLYFLRRPFQKTRGWQQLIEVSYILLLAPLIFPHQQTYAFLFMAPAYAVVLYYVYSKYKTIPPFEKTALVALLIIVYLASDLKILLGEFNRYYEHFKILTYGALLLIPMLVWVWRRSRTTNGFSAA